MSDRHEIKQRGLSACDTATPMISHDGELCLVKQFFGDDEARATYEQLLTEIDWQDESIYLFGRTVPIPRKVSWYGDPGSEYTYSGVLHKPMPWTATLANLRTRLEEKTGKQFNSVLCNLYRNGRNSMGWHADKETELGDAPFIASLSFGDTRTFLMRHNKTKETLSIDLNGGSLLLMSGYLQKNWRHCVPKTNQLKHARINLTFRLIVSARA